MRAFQVASVLALAAQALAHGYIYRVTADNTVYPGWDYRLDTAARPAPARIAYANSQVSSINDVKSPNMACNIPHTPAPGDIAQARAGSNITFHWSHWLYSHKGPITAWMAPYEGDVAKVDINKLEFVKFAEDIVDKDGVWATVKMMDQTNGTWTATIPADIKPGKYIIRQEIIALHFAVSLPPGFQSFPLGPQFYFTCFNFNVTAPGTPEGAGTATPKGVTFPGAYDIAEPGFHFDIKSNNTYPPVGPPVYRSKYQVNLSPKERVTVSPTGKGKDADDAYYQKQYQVLQQQGAMTSYFDSIGG